MSKNTPLQKERRLGLWITIAAACIVIGGGIWLVRGWLDVFSHIMPSGTASVSPSISMELYDISAKAKVYKDGEVESDHIISWELKVPRAYIDKIEGTNGGVEQMVKDEESGLYLESKGGVGVSLAAHVLADGETLEPYTKMAEGQKEFDDDTMKIGFGAGHAAWWKSQYDLCVPQDKDEEIMRKYDAGLGSNLDCFKTIKFCYVSTQLDGWNVVVNVTKRLYAQPEKVCALAKKFLNAYTIRRDIYPWSKPNTYTFPMNKKP